MLERASVEVVVVRVYMLGGSSNVDTLLKRLHAWGKVRGVTVLRGIQGYGGSTPVRPTTSLTEEEMPLVVEFYEEPERLEAILGQLEPMPGVRHIIHWPAFARAVVPSDGA
ncbi:MAG: DUF190 domain-containing protein [Myxococcales bacterium]|nr:DUF190 domain-containing protein [Myxococcales bacterium]